MAQFFQMRNIIYCGFFDLISVRIQLSILKHFVDIMVGDNFILWSYLITIFIICINVLKVFEQLLKLLLRNKDFDSVFLPSSTDSIVKSIDKQSKLFDVSKYGSLASCHFLKCIDDIIFVMSIVIHSPLLDFHVLLVWHILGLYFINQINSLPNWGSRWYFFLLYWEFSLQIWIEIISMFNLHLTHGYADKLAGLNFIFDLNIECFWLISILGIGLNTLM